MDGCKECENVSSCNVCKDGYEMMGTMCNLIPGTRRRLEEDYNTSTAGTSTDCTSATCPNDTTASVSFA